MDFVELRIHGVSGTPPDDLLASKPGRVFLRNEILNQIWGADVIVGDRTIDVHVRKVRQKLGIDCITTVKGVGYKFEL